LARKQAARPWYRQFTFAFTGPADSPGIEREELWRRRAGTTLAATTQESKSFCSLTCSAVVLGLVKTFLIGNHLLRERGGCFFLPV